MRGRAGAGDGSGTGGRAGSSGSAGSSAGVETVRAARARLEAAATVLRERTPAELLGALAATLELWRDPRSRFRRALLERHPGAAGIGRECVRVGLELGLADWSGDALRALVARELAPELAAGARLSPFSLTSVSLAGSIPMPSLLQCLLPLALHSPLLVRTASRDPVTAPLVAESLAEIDPALGRCIEVVSFASDDAPALEHFLAADCVVASGSDETLRAIAARLQPSQRLVGYGHKLSIALIGPEATRGAAETAAVAEVLSLDIALWDQLGCLSPVSVFLLEPDAAKRSGAVARLAEALAAALAQREARMPRGPLAPAEAALIRHERSEAEMRAAAGRAVALHGDAGLRFSVVAEEDASWRPAPLHRFVRVQPLASLEQLEDATRSFARHLGGVAVAGFDEAGSGVCSRQRALSVAAALGASRICHPGALQAPPLGWHHDGRPVLLPLARFVDLEVA